MSGRFLEIGPGAVRLGTAWVTLDAERREGVDYTAVWGKEPLPFEDDRFELIYASHVLEHIPWFQTVAAIREAHRVLMPGGQIEIHVPDFSVLIDAAQQQVCFDDHSEQGLNQELHWMHWVAERLFHIGPERQWHRACFDEAHLRWCFEQAGFSELSKLPSERGSDHGLVNLGLRGVKVSRLESDLPSAKGEVEVHIGR